MGASKAVKVIEVVEKSEGQKLVEKMEAWLSGYMFLPADYALVASLWAIMTWCFDKFDVIPYLVITAAVKGAGKTTFAELIARLSFNPVQWGSATPATMYRMLGEKDGKMSLFVDEAEDMTRESTAGALRAVLNVGFRRGGKVARTGAGGKVEEFPAFCPKELTLIGNVFDTLRDRSIVLWLQKGGPEALARLKDYDFSMADGEAGAIVGSEFNPAVGTIRHTLANIPAVMAVRPAFLSGRDRDIWAAIFGLAAALKLDDATIDRLTRVAADISMEKKSDATKRPARAESESAANDANVSEKLVRDVARVFREGEEKLFTVTVIERLKGLVDGGWNKYRGTGIDAMSLASLLRRHGVERQVVRMARVAKGVAAPQANGYTRTSILAAVERMGGAA
jgi:hypothetical protein